MPLPKNILICPLDWGIGHASRCVPLIRKLLEIDCKVFIAADNLPLAFLKQEFPDLTFIIFPGYKINYQKKGPLFLKMLKLIPGLLINIYREHRRLEVIILEYNITVVISDNRFGLWHHKIHSIYMTHQLNIKTPIRNYLLDIILYRIHRFFIKHYDECWIPDYEGKNNFSGGLSHRFTKPEKAFFVGPLSRFEAKYDEHETDKDAKIDFIFDLMAIISGPEPQRSLFEKLITKQIKETGLKAVIVRGLPDEKQYEQTNEGHLIFSHLPSERIREFMLKSCIIICRSGYSSIMDISALGKNAIFIPTPGQTEQEYLASYFESNKCFYYMKQKEFDLAYALEQSAGYNGFSIKYNPALLNDRIKNMIEILEGID